MVEPLQLQQTDRLTVVFMKVKEKVQEILMHTYFT